MREHRHKKTDHPSWSPLDKHGACRSRTPDAVAPASAAAPATAKTRKLSYKEQRELEALPELIASLEAELKEPQAALSDSSLYASDPAKVAQIHKRDTEIEDALMTALERWEQLSSPA
jgi:ATP-binding cassette subfamily F protein uup